MSDSVSIEQRQQSRGVASILGRHGIALAEQVIKLSAEYLVRLEDLNRDPSEDHVGRLAVSVDRLRAALHELDQVSGETVEAYMRIATPADGRSQNFEVE